MISVDSVSKTFKLYRTPSDRLKEIFLRKSFHTDFHAVNAVSFSVREGETIGIIGENGAGKSTLLKLLTGVLIPDSGHVHIDGRVTGLLELGTGFNPEFSGMENIIHNATYLGLSRSQINDRLSQIIEFTELGEFIHEPIKTYSSGMVMRLAFSVAIHADPRAFVVDEALSVGDAYFQQKCMKRILEFKASGGAIVFVSHDMNAVKILCDRAMLLNQGRAVESGSPETIINSYNYLIAHKSKGKEISYRDECITSGYGNQKAVIDNVSICGEDDQPAEIFISGRPAKIAIRITGYKDMDDITVGVLIRDRFGQDIFGTNSYHLEKEISIRAGRHVCLVYDFAELNLGPGKYSITAAVHTGSTHVEECVHWMDKCVAFEVVTGADPVFSGLLRMTPQLYFTEGMNSDFFGENLC